MNYGNRNPEKLKRTSSWMRARNMSENTISSYIPFLVKLFEFAKCDSSKISQSTIQDFILSISADYSDSYQNQAINAIKLYFRVIENRKIKDIMLPRPIRDQYVPKILNKEQYLKVALNTANLKHRAILFTIVDNGLRISELLNLELSDFVTKCVPPYITLRETKHHGNRSFKLSQECIDLVKEYYIQYRPLKYLFEGEPGKKYSATSIRNILNAALKREGLQHIRVHDLRHSFSTNCLANNMNIHHLSKVLGHKSFLTTEKYYSHLTYKQINIPR
jgi:integrase/recombinase XerD